MGKRTCSDMETADESVQKDVQPEQHEEAQPKRKAKGFDLVSGGANCKQTSAVLCDLWHNFQVLHARPGDALGRNAAQSRGRQRHAVCKECLGRADGGVEEVQDLGSKTRVRIEARDRQDCQLHPRDADRSTQKPKRSLRRDLGGCKCGTLLAWKSSLIARQTQT